MKFWSFLSQKINNCLTFSASHSRMEGFVFHSKPNIFGFSHVGQTTIVKDVGIIAVSFHYLMPFYKQNKHVGSDL